MFSTLLRRHSSNCAPRDTNPRREEPSAGTAYRNTRHATADFTEAEDDDENTNDGGPGEDDDDDDDNDDDDDDDDDDAGDVGDEDGVRRPSMPMLPLFSTSYLDSLPVYGITHAIRVIVSARTETTLSWDQLRSPQVSQFLIKPMQQQIRSNHFSRATLYALMANCLQFSKETELYPGNASTSSTRAKVCELLAMKLLKEYSTRELIDALSYDFYPLQGSPSAKNMDLDKRDTAARAMLSASRTSTLEVAIMASAKKFLSHPTVVQQLEAIWNGAITFYSAADNLHRDKFAAAPDLASSQDPHPVARRPLGRKPDARTPLLAAGHARARARAPPRQEAQRPVALVRRSVALYDPREASLLKLSRLRVPRYRFFLANLSLGVLIALFLAVLSRRSTKITALEVFFWFWSAGYMLDELVGFNEQGFSLYILSFWNLFDLGILAILIIYYCMRLYGVFHVDQGNWHDLAFDSLGACSILLLPRIFSVLDHYRYFSKLFLAFRLMAVDLLFLFLIVMISCSGFFVFFTMSKTDVRAPEVAYRIFQILMGYTPAAWEIWDQLGVLGQAVMSLFLIICHFVVVTILITVMTNSFTFITANANEEHQYLFAINTFSFVKGGALFSYVAPSNLFAWLFMPMRYCMPLKKFVWFNRTVIKATHFPILLCIYLYERFWLASSIYEPTDLVENARRERPRAISFAEPAGRSVFNANPLAREESVAGFHKDRALDDLFRSVPNTSSLRAQNRHERRRAQRAIRHWMDQHDVPGPPLSHWPTIDSRTNAAPAAEHHPKRFSIGRDRPFRTRRVSDVRSTASDPADMYSVGGPRHHPSAYDDDAGTAAGREATYRDLTDADGDDELVTNDEDEDEEEEQVTNAGGPDEDGEGVDVEDDYFTPIATRFRDHQALSSSPGSGNQPVISPPRAGAAAAAAATTTTASASVVAAASAAAAARRALHNRTMSTNTILYNPQVSPRTQVSSTASPDSRASRPMPGRLGTVDTRTTARNGGGGSGSGSVEHRRSPRRPVPTSTTARPRPAAAAAGAGAATATRGAPAPPVVLSGRGVPFVSEPRPRDRPNVGARLPSLDVSVMSDNTNLLIGDPGVAIPSSFQTQMMVMFEKNQKRSKDNRAESSDRMSKLVLARMNKLEESFADVVREMREMRSSSNVSVGTAPESPSSVEEQPAAARAVSSSSSSKGRAKPRSSSGLSRMAGRRSAKDAKTASRSTDTATTKGKEKEASAFYLAVRKGGNGGDGNDDGDEDVGEDAEDFRLKKGASSP